MTTKDKILSVLIREMNKQPIEKIGVRDIAAKAKVNVAAVNYHFSSKENLFTEAINKIVLTNLDNWVAENLDLQKATRADLARFLTELHYNTIEYRNFSRTKMHHLISSEQPDLPNQRIFAIFSELLASLQVDKKRIPLHASVLFNSLLSFSVSPETAASQAGFGTSKTEVEKYIDQLLKTILP